MQTFLTALLIYGLTIVFALVIAAILHGLGIVIKKLNLDREEQIDTAIPSSDSEREQESVAIAIAVATAARAGRLPVKPSTPNS